MLVILRSVQSSIIEEKKVITLTTSLRNAFFAHQKEHVKFKYSEKATKFLVISTLLLSYVVPVKSKVEISQNFVAFSEYMNFIWQELFQ